VKAVKHSGYLRASWAAAPTTIVESDDRSGAMKKSFRLALFSLAKKVGNDWYS